MGRLGFEPKTNRLKAECSTAELATHNDQAFLRAVFYNNRNHRKCRGFFKKK